MCSQYQLRMGSRAELVSEMTDNNNTNAQLVQQSLPDGRSPPPTSPHSTNFAWQQLNVVRPLSDTSVHPHQSPSAHTSNLPSLHGAVADASRSEIVSEGLGPTETIVEHEVPAGAQLAATSTASDHALTIARLEAALAEARERSHAASERARVMERRASRAEDDARHLRGEMEHHIRQIEEIRQQSDRKLEEGQARAQTLSQQLHAQRDENRTLRAELSEERQRCIAVEAERRREHEYALKLRNEHQMEIRRREQAIDERQRESRRAAHAIESLNQDRERFAQTSQALAAAQDEIARLEDEMTSARRQLEAIEADRDQERDAREKAEEDLARIWARSINMEQETEKERTRATALTDQLAQERKLVSRLQLSLASTHDHVQEAQAQIAHLEQELTHTHQQVVLAESERAQERQRVAEMEEALRAAERRHTNAVHERDLEHEERVAAQAALVEQINLLFRVEQDRDDAVARAQRHERKIDGLHEDLKDEQEASGRRIAWAAQERDRALQRADVFEREVDVVRDELASAKKALAAERDRSERSARMLAEERTRVVELDSELLVGRMRAQAREREISAQSQYIAAMEARFREQEARANTAEHELGRLRYLEIERERIAAENIEKEERVRRAADAVRDHEVAESRRVSEAWLGAEHRRVVRFARARDAEWVRADGEAQQRAEDIRRVRQRAEEWLEAQITAAAAFSARPRLKQDSQEREGLGGQDEGYQGGRQGPAPEVLAAATGTIPATQDSSTLEALSNSVTTRGNENVKAGSEPKYLDKPEPDVNKSDAPCDEANSSSGGNGVGPRDSSIVTEPLAITPPPPIVDAAETSGEGVSEYATSAGGPEAPTSTASEHAESNPAAGPVSPSSGNEHSGWSPLRQLARIISDTANGVRNISVATINEVTDPTEPEDDKAEVAVKDEAEGRVVHDLEDNEPGSNHQIDHSAPSIPSDGNETSQQMSDERTISAIPGDDTDDLLQYGPISAETMRRLLMIEVIIPGALFPGSSPDEH